MWFWGKRRFEKESFVDIIRQIKEGDKLLKERFIADYRPFILKSISYILGKYIEVENSEEFSIGLAAFNEAIDSYDEEKNCTFKIFSQQVIKRRLIDYKRSNYKNGMTFPFSYFENKESNDFEEQYLKNEYPDHSYKFEIKEEFRTFTESLKKYGITIESLISVMPKHKDARQKCVEIARILAENKELYTKLSAKKTIPFTDLMRCIDVSKRTVERNRKYIIALVIVIKSDMDVLKSYIKNMEQGG